MSPGTAHRSNNMSPVRMFQGTGVIEKDQLSIRHLKARLNQIDTYLDVDKLLSEVKSHHNDSYSLRMLLSKVKEHTG